MIDAALTVIAEDGLSQLTLAKVAGRAGLTAAMVNFHFKSKSDLLLATLRGLATEFQDRIASAVAHAPDDPLAKLNALIDANFDPVLSAPSKIAVWYAFWGETQARAEYQAVCGESDAAYDRLAQALVRQAAERAGLAVDAEALAQGLIGLIDGQWQSLLAAPVAFDRDRARDLCRRYLRAVLPNGGGRAASRDRQTDRDTSGDLPARRLWSLPAWSYRHQELFEAECERLHLPAWQLVCHVSQIPEAGDYMTFELLGRRAFVVRDRMGALRAFHNVCRHRAHAVVEGETGRCPGLIRCPYHGWTYELDGRLRAIAARKSFSQIDSGADSGTGPGCGKAGLGLEPIEHEIFMGLVFIRFQPGGPSVAARMAPFAEELAHYRIEDVRPLERWWHRDTGVDWKNVWDNYLEGYHFPTGHPGLDRLMHRRYQLDTWPAEKVARLWHPFKKQPTGGWSTRAYRSLLPAYDHLPAPLEGSWRYYVLFPSLALDVYPDQLDFFQVIPVAPGQSRLRGHNYALPDTRRAARAVRWLNWRINARVQREDDALIASVQKGLESGSYQRGPLSDKESLLGAFQDWIADSLPVADLDEPPAPGTLKAVNDRLIAQPDQGA